MTDRSIVKGSLGDIARNTSISIAEAFLDADVMVLVDVSGSMGARDSREGKSRFVVACEELGKLQRELPGKIAVIAFASGPRFSPGGVPEFLGGGTDLASALRFILPADGTVDVWIISDGVPDSQEEALRVARRMQSRINAVYVGPEGGSGRDFLRELTRLRGGKAATAAQAIRLAETIRQMLGPAQA